MIPDKCQLSSKRLYIRLRASWCCDPRGLATLSIIIRQRRKGLESCFQVVLPQQSRPPGNEIRESESQCFEADRNCHASGQRWCSAKNGLHQHSGRLPFQ